MLGSMNYFHRTALLTVPLAALVLSACTDAGPPEEESPIRFEAAERLIAIGDLHGDLEAARTALRLGLDLSADF